MKLKHLLTHARRNLTHARSRTLLTSFAIAIGAFVLTLSFGASEGMRQFAQHFLEKNVDPSALTIVKDDRTLAIAFGMNAEPIEYKESDYLADTGAVVGLLSASDIDRVVDLPQIKTATQLYDAEMKYVSGANGKKYRAPIYGYGPSNAKYDLAAGQVPKTAQDLGKDKIVIPERFVKPMGFKSPSDAIGKPVMIRVTGYDKTGKVEDRDYTFYVQAVTKKIVNLFESDPAFMITHSSIRQLSLFQKDLGERLETVWGTATLEEGVTMDEAKAAVESLGYGAATPRDQAANIYQLSDMLSLAIIVFSVFTIVASVFGVINTQYISVLERTRYIGLMKSMGMRQRQVMGLFMGEAAFIGLFGGLIGILLALGLGLAINVPVSNMLGFTHSMLFVFNPLYLGGLLSGLVLVAIVAGYLPARKAARLDPVDALRRE